MALKELLAEKLTKEELNKLKKSFDIIGSVAIIEIPEELEPDEKVIAEAIMKTHPSVETVCKKLDERKGSYRLRKIKPILGKGTETVHTEYGCRFRLDVKKVYFSPRELTERQRIAGLVKPGETILVMFAGVGPYPIQIAKKSPDVKIYAVEINKKAYEYMNENVKLNKVQNLIETILGDVRDSCRHLYGKCDRVVMPLPLEGYKYLPIALKCIKPNGVIHFYSTGHESEPFKEAETILKKACEDMKIKCEILERTKVLPYAPRIWKICLDVKVKK
jgi:tRNA (guanine37-N1)-methyltransferase